MQREPLINHWLSNSLALQRVWRQHFQAGLGDQQLSMGQAMLLFYLLENQPVSNKQVVDDMCSSKSAVTQLVESLDKLGYVVRHTDPSDRRVIYVGLSKKGTDKARILQKKREQLYRQLADSLTDGELIAINEIQQKMLSHLQTAVREAAGRTDG